MAQQVDGREMRGHRGRTGSWIEEGWREGRGTGLGERGREREDALVERRRPGRSRVEEKLLQWEDGETTGPVRMEEKTEAGEDTGWLGRMETEEVIWRETLKEETQARQEELEREDVVVRWRRRREDRKQVRRKQRRQEVVMFPPLGGEFPRRVRKDEAQQEQE